MIHDLKPRTHDSTPRSLPAPINRSQLWQWVRHGARTAEGQVVTAQLVNRLLEEELQAVRAKVRIC